LNEAAVAALKLMASPRRGRTRSDGTVFCNTDVLASSTSGSRG
jgi:hypothetical protein